MSVVMKGRPCGLKGIPEKDKSYPPAHVDVTLFGIKSLQM